MSDLPRYSVDEDIEEAEAVARELPQQIARLRGMVKVAHAVLNRDEEDQGRTEPRPG